MNQIIYRMQNSHGEGPYRKHCLAQMDDDLHYELFCIHSGDPNRPVPIKDTMKRWPTKREICGFTTLNQANRWFPLELRIRLGKYGFRLAKVKVNRITLIGKYQCFATKEAI